MGVRVLSMGYAFVNGKYLWESSLQSSLVFSSLSTVESSR